jgi:hypothetical protein
MANTVIARKDLRARLAAADDACSGDTSMGKDTFGNSQVIVMKIFTEAEVIVHMSTRTRFGERNLLTKGLRKSRLEPVNALIW